MGRAPTRRIIAVFGGGTASPKVLNLAEEFGRLIAERGLILLTGGIKAANDSVKGRAINGAQHSGSGRLIGIERASQVSGSVGTGSSVERRWLKIWSDAEHRRNYLEACMCDAAVGLKGEDGTVSEIACALALKRPVAFVGDHWKHVCDLDNDRKAAVEYLMTRTAHRFDAAPRKPSLDQLLERNVYTPRPRRSLTYKYFGSQDEPAAVLEWLCNALPPGRGSRRYLPPIEGHERVSQEFDRWLRGQAA